MTDCRAAKSPDKRPALVFDNVNEVKTIVNALEIYRTEKSIDGHISDGSISMLVRELEKVANLFKKW